MKKAIFHFISEKQALFNVKGALVSEKEHFAEKKGQLVMKRVIFIERALFHWRGKV